MEASSLEGGTVAVLRKARALIDAPEKWTTGQYAKDADGGFCDTWSQATCFCASGALLAAGDVGLDEFNVASGWEDAYALLSRQMRGNIIDFNDSRTHAEVLAAFDKAIAAAEAA